MTVLSGKRIAVLAGGPSSEREVSLRSGAAVFKALKKLGYNAVFVEISDDIRDSIDCLDVDVAFLALHGGAGEDGTIQSMLEDRDIVYTGSGPEASKLAMDKILSKKVFEKKGVPTPGWYAVSSGGDLAKVPDGFTLPLVVKPACEGSSVGLSIVREKGALEISLKDALSFGQTVLVEKYIEGRELTVGILGDTALPVVEIFPKDKVYDFEAKYKDTETVYKVPAELNDAERKMASDLGLMAHRALGCRDLSRVDIRMDPNGGMFVLEVNTLPGMTERSLLPKAAMAQGLEFEILCSRLLEMAIKRR